MPRYVIDVQYRGSAYSGWQLQATTDNTVQANVDRVLGIVLRQPVSTYGAGRTDAGVHAIGLPVQFDYEGEIHPSFRHAMNSILPYDIAVMAVYKALTDDFHVRYKAIRRAYRYRIVFEKTPVSHGLAWWCKTTLDVEKMQEGAQMLKEYSNFKCFAKGGGATNHICLMEEARFIWEGKELVFYIKANRFLRGMVRAIVGTLTMVGEGTLTLEGLRNVLESGDRKLAGPNVPPDGLYLSEVIYPEGMLEEIHFTVPPAPAKRFNWR